MAGRGGQALLWVVLVDHPVRRLSRGYERPEFQRSAFETLLDPVALFRFFLAALGSLAVRLLPAVPVGTCLAATSGSLIVRRADGIASARRLACLRRPLVAAMAVRRVSLATGRTDRPLSRVLEMAFLVTLLPVLHQVGPNVPPAILWAALPLSVGWFAVNWQTACR